MSNLEELDKLLAKPKTYKIPKDPKEGQEQASLTITPFDLDADLSALDLADNAPLKETMQKTKEFIGLALGCEATKVGKLSLEYMMDIMDAILDANNFDEKNTDKIEKLKQFMASKGGTPVTKLPESMQNVPGANRPA